MHKKYIFYALNLSKRSVIFFYLMSNKKFCKNINIWILLSIIIIIWLFIIYIFFYLFYNTFSYSKIHKKLPKNIDWFIEFKIDSLNFIKEILPNEYLPWFFSYKDKLNWIDNWALLFYKWKKIDIINIWSIKLLKNFFNNIKLNDEKFLNDWYYFKLSQSSVPDCIYKNKLLYCSKYKEILNDLLKNNSNLIEDKNFKIIKNNLYRKNKIFAYFNSNYLKNFYFIWDKFDSLWFAFKQKWNHIDWILYWLNSDFLKLKNDFLIEIS